jgi:vancomycin resistance protein YoaR
LKLNALQRWVVVSVAAVILTAVGGFALARALGADEVLGSVTALGVQLGGLTRPEVDEALDEAERALLARPAAFGVAGATVQLDPAQVGLDIDTAAMADEALAVGREGDLGRQFRWWLRHFGQDEPIPTRAAIEPDLVEAVLAGWDTDVVGDVPFPGGIILDGIEPVAEYPREGETIDRSVAPALILDSLTAFDPVVVDLPIVVKSPDLTNGDVDAAVAKARLWLSSSVTLSAEERQIVFSRENLAAALVTKPSDSALELSFDAEQVEAALEAVRGDLESPPEDARFEIEDDNTVTVVPGRAGTLIDPEATARELATAADRASRRGVLPFVEGALPEVTTEELESLGVEHLVAQFTTFHDCCQNRVTNIHLIADAVDGAVVAPGAVFSVNDRVGPRTEEDGYLEDGAIVGGELTQTIGGGVSQFATTLYNAVFWGGFEDVTHKPHSFHFPRYPMGIEATISWREPDLQFRNDSESGVLIKTSYTDTSITVRLYGNNDGRSVVGAYPIGGPLELLVDSEGGRAARTVSAEVSDPFGYTEPRDTLYRPDPDLDVEDSRTVQSSKEGWSVVVTRTVTYKGEESTQEWLVVYAPRQEIVEVHPCQVPGTSVECPAPETTTTIAPETTTTAPVDTTQPPTETTVPG